MLCDLGHPCLPLFAIVGVVVFLRLLTAVGKAKKEEAEAKNELQKAQARIRRSISASRLKNPLGLIWGGLCWAAALLALSVGKVEHAAGLAVAGLAFYFAMLCFPGS